MKFQYLLVSCSCVLPCVHPANALENSPSGNPSPKDHSQNSNLPYATHDVIVDHVLDLWTEEENKWLFPYKTTSLLAAEILNKKQFHDECYEPHNGYDEDVRWRKTI